MSLFEIGHDQEFHSHPHPPSKLHQGQDQSHNTMDADGRAGSSQPQHPKDNTDNNSNNNSSNNHTRRTKSKTRTTRINPKYKSPGRPRYAALLELSYGLILYISCIFLPSFPHYIYQTYIWTSTWSNYMRERMLWSIWICWRFSLVVLDKLGWMDNPFRVIDQTSTMNDADTMTGVKEDAPTGPGMRRFGRKIGKFIRTTSTASLWEEFNQQQSQREDLPTSKGYSWGFGRTTSAFPAILMVLQDIQILLMLAVTLAIVRVWFVHMLVPEYLAPQRLEAMTRCKSSHLLSSSSYSLDELKRIDSVASLRRDLGSMMREAEEEKSRGWYGRMGNWVSKFWYRLRPTVRRALGHEPSAKINAIVSNQPTHRSPFRRSSSNGNPTQHLFSAPRYATATFRLLFTSISCITALILFSEAEFWPRHVFGTHPHASTRHCWDLSGSFSALGFLDDDYDARNGALKYFFLTQAAYQLHSLCFHIVSMLLLMLYGGGSANSVGSSNNGAGGWVGKLVGRLRGGTSTNQQQQQLNPLHQQGQQQTKSKRLISMKTSMQSYFRPMVEHVIVLALLLGAYLFSGIRRLGAVGIFTLELSSVFLQLLQVCIYAPENSWWRKPEVVLFVHRMLTVPTFVYCRLIILPFILWRSALFESQEWLEQTGKVFSPGWAERIYTMSNVSLCFIFVLNLVLFPRLLFHPHLKQI